MEDLHGKAIYDYYKGDHGSLLMVNNTYGEPEEMPIDYFFRDQEDFSDLENMAISMCYGKILDIGAGAGAHSLFMQALEIDISAIEKSPGCISTLEQSGMKQLFHGDFQGHQGKYDTLLVLMCGLGIIGKLDNLSQFLNTCKGLLNEGGQILVDSSDITYLYEDGLQKPAHYFGELSFQYEYKNEKGEWFDWVYIDQDTLKEKVSQQGLQIEILFNDDSDQYLARIFGF